MFPPVDPPLSDGNEIPEPPVLPEFPEFAELTPRIIHSTISATAITAPIIINAILVPFFFGC